MLALLLPELGSNWSLWLMLAVLDWAAGLITVAWMSRVCGTVVVTVPTVQTPLVLSYEPWLGVADTKVSPAGSRSWIVTLLAESGPAFVSVTVKVIVLPTLGVGLLTILLMTRSACCGVSPALAVLLPASGSNWSAALTVAVLVRAPGLTTRAARMSVRAPLVSTVPTVQIPLVGS